MKTNMVSTLHANWKMRRKAPRGRFRTDIYSALKAIVFACVYYVNDSIPVIILSSKKYIKVKSKETK